MNTKHTPIHLLILTIALILVGCGGEPSPTLEPPTADAATLAVPTSESDDLTITPDIIATNEPTVISPFPTLEVPVYPTVIETPFPTPDPAIPPAPTEELAAAPSGFERIVLIRTGGPVREDGTTADEVIILNRLDSTITRGQATGSLSEAAANRIAGLIDAANFFTIDGVFLGAVPAEPPLPFLYNITVFNGGMERSISAQDGFMNTEIQSLVGAVLSEGQRVPNP